jgi:hypothetical protein
VPYTGKPISRATPVYGLDLSLLIKRAEPTSLSLSEMGEWLDNVTKSLSSVLNMRQDAQQSIEGDGNPLSFLNFGQASLQSPMQPNKDDDLYILNGGNPVSCEDAKRLQAEFSRKYQRDFQGDVGILKEALRQLVERQKNAPVNATKLAQDHKSMAAIKGKEIKKLCEERSARLPSTIQRKDDPSNDDQAKNLSTAAREKAKERERHDLHDRMGPERQKRRADAENLTKTGKEYEDKGNFHGAIAAYDRALRILLYGTSPSPRREELLQHRPQTAQTSPTCRSFSRLCRRASPRATRPAC